MAPITVHSTEQTHAKLLDELDMQKLPKPFRNPTWKPPQRRNKNLKQILNEADKARQSAINSQLNSVQQSGATTPMQIDSGSGADTPSVSLNPTQASQDLSRLVLEKNAASKASLTASYGSAATALNLGPSVTYASIAAGPSIKPKKKYCDITGLPAKYKDPKTGLFYYNAEIYAVVKGLTTTQVQEYLAARGANTILK